MLRLIPLLAAHLICGAVSPAADGGPGFDGKWRLFVYPAGSAVCSVEVDGGRSPHSVSLSSVADGYDLGKSTVQSPRIHGDALRFDLKLVPRSGPSRVFSVAVYQNGGEVLSILLGSFGSAGDVRFPAEPRGRPVARACTGYGHRGRSGTVSTSGPSHAPGRSHWARSDIAIVGRSGTTPHGNNGRRNASSLAVQGQSP